MFVPLPAENNVCLIYFYKLAFTLKHLQLMWEYLARTLKGKNCESTETGAVTQRINKSQFVQGTT